MRVAILGVPLDLGAARRGTDMGPSAIRYARLHEVLASLGHQLLDAGNIPVPVAESLQTSPGPLPFLEEVAAACRRVAARVGELVQEGWLPLVLGGDHSLAIGTLAGLRHAGAARGVIWIDAHGDFNTPQTSPSGNIHGMPLAVATGRGAPLLLEVCGGPAVAEEAAVLVGVRDLDPGERAQLRASDLAVYTMKEIDALGIAAVMHRAIRQASGEGRRPIHLSFDLDALDPLVAPGVGTPVPGGLTYREAHLAMELIADSGLLGSAEFVEVNPILDQRNQTAQLAVELIASALGHRIL